MGAPQPHSILGRLQALVPKARAWPAWQLEMVRRHYATTRTDVLAAAIGRKPQHVYSMALRLGLRKGPEFLASDRSGRILRGGKLGQQHQFKPGIVPWNKGLKGLDIGGRATRFQPGQRPHTWLPVGSLRINAEGYLERKYSDDPGSPSKRWRTVARLVWEAAHGPLPPGHAVVFRPGRASTRVEDITLDAVECITRAELMRRNTVHNLPPELVEVVRLRAVLTRAIRTKQKELQP